MLATLTGGHTSFLTSLAGRGSSEILATVSDALTDLGRRELAEVRQLQRQPSLMDFQSLWRSERAEVLGEASSRS